MTNTLEAVVALAATHRLTNLVVEDEVTRPVREYIDDRWPDSRLNYLVNCPRCVSVWAGAAIAALPKPLRWTLALSGGTMLIKWAAELAESVAAGE